MLAKIASDYRKPDGLFTIPPGQIEEFVAALPIERFFGIGEVTARKMHGMGIHTGADLRLRDEAELVRHFGKAGHSYYGYARGIDDREVQPHRIRKSLGAEEAYNPDGLVPRVVQALKAQARARGVQRTALVSVQGSRLYWERQGYAVESVTNAAQQQHLASYGEGALYMVGFI